MIKILIIGLGGFLGSISRYSIYQLLDRNIESMFPLGTFFVNTSGSLLLGVIYGLMEKGNVLTEEWRLFLAIGFCGSFTTFSAFAYENFTLLKSSQFLSMLTYTGLSVVVGIGLTYLGYLLATYDSW